MMDAEHMVEGPKVSVVMPVYNAGAYVREAILSVVDQTLVDWELIVIDDGSTDASAQAIARFADPRIHVIHQQNSGVAVARNRGLAAASGEYLAFLDADDVFFPTALASNASYLDAHRDRGVVYADGMFCNRAGQSVARLSDYLPAEHEGDVLDALVVTPFIAVCTAMIRRQVVATRGLRFEPDRPLGEDWEFFIRLAETERFGRNPEAIFKYRRHAQNATLASSSERAANAGQIRLGVLTSPVIGQLAPATVATLFYQLLFESFPEQPEMHLRLVTDRSFARLSAHDQGRLLRLVAAHWLRQGWSVQRARALLDTPIDHRPRSAKAWLLRLATYLPPDWSRALLNARRRPRVSHNGQGETPALRLFEELA
jgi:hypothetical protein